MATLQTLTLAELAYRRLRDRIVRGELLAGQRLMPEELGQELSISPTPVKEALLMLERDGLIVSTARRGSIVRRFTPRDIAELYEARLMIEQRAISVGFATGQVNDAMLSRISICAALYAERSNKRTAQDLRQARRHDHDLHTLFVALDGNALIAEWHQRLLRQTQLVRAYSLRAYDAGQVARSERDHAAILAGLRVHDPATVIRALEAHLTQSSASAVANQS